MTLAQMRNQARGESPHAVPSILLLYAVTIFTHALPLRSVEAGLRLIDHLWAHVARVPATSEAVGVGRPVLLTGVTQYRFSVTKSTKFDRCFADHGCEGAHKMGDEWMPGATHGACKMGKCDCRKDESSRTALGFRR